MVRFFKKDDDSWDHEVINYEIDSCGSLVNVASINHIFNISKHLQVCFTFCSSEVESSNSAGIVPEFPVVTFVDLKWGSEELVGHRSSFMLSSEGAVYLEFNCF